MPMKIKKIEDYIGSGGFYSPFHPDTGSSKSAMVPANPSFQIKAIRADNLQIFAKANSYLAYLQIKSSTIINAQSSKTYIVEFNFNSNNDYTQISYNEYDLSNSTGQTNFLSKINALSSNNYFAILSSGVQTITSSIQSTLYSKADWFVQACSSGAIQYVAVGYNGVVIDSMFTSGDSGLSQIYVNGQDAAYGKSFSSNGTYYELVLTSDLTSGVGVDIDYIHLLHNKGSNNFIIKDHKITVVDSTGTTIYIKQNNFSNLETIAGNRYYLFGDLGTNAIIKGGLESSIAMAGYNEALNRGVTQNISTNFFDTLITGSRTDAIYNNFTAFDNSYSAGITKIETNDEKIDIEPIIRNEERIKYNLSTCNSGCSFACHASCDVLCTTGCGVTCGTTCNKQCSSGCEFSCTAICGAVCGGGCGAACTITCSAACSGGTCGSACTGTCSGGCAGGCAAGSCSGICTGGCSNTIFAWCASCGNGCYGHGCANSGCSGTCGSGCSGYTCGNNCYYTCGSGCIGNCWNSCGIACGGACSNTTCGTTCTANCMSDCTVLCGSGTCSWGCINSCSDTCISSSSTSAKGSYYI